MKSSLLYSVFIFLALQVPSDFNAQASPFSELKSKSISHSVLSRGKWIKIGVIKNEIYRLDYNFFKNEGLDPSSIDPRTIRLYGNGCFMLPQENSAPRAEDLTENKIYVKGEDDGHFDPGDYVLFYGESPHRLSLSDSSGKVSVDYRYNLYSDTTYYFLTFGDKSGKRISVSDLAGAGLPVVTTWDDLEYHEENNTNILESGREWYGEKFDFQTSYDFNYDLPGILSGSSLEIISSVMAQSFSATSFDVSVNGIIIGSQAMDPIPDATYAVKGIDRTDDFSVNVNSITSPDKLKLTLSYNKTSGQGVGFLNYFILHCERELSYAGKDFVFQSQQSLSYPEIIFEVKNANVNNRVWDISDPLQPMEIKPDLQGDNMRFATETSGLKTFIVFEDGNASLPASARTITNQDLHGSAVPQLLIIANPLFSEAAQKLADFRNSENGISGLVATTEQVYNEFSSGAQDVTALRDFIKYLYDKGNKTTLKYVLLFGKGSFDYKNVISGNTDFVPIYESRNSLHPIFSYASDDYFGFMDDNEGYWDETSQGDNTMDVAVGRLPVLSKDEADIIVNKLIGYETAKDRYGDWRSKICFVADDGDGVDGIIHERDADRLATLVDTLNPNYSVKKIYVDAYPQVLTPGTETSPEAKQAVQDEVNKGVLIINFTGHGNESQWTSEDVMDLPMITGFNNRSRLPLFITATCEFGRHDDPRLISGAEYALFNETGGAIALVTTSRPVFSSTNFILNQAFYDHLFLKKNNQFQTLGEIFEETKNSSLNGSINRNFSLLGDPSMKLAFPDYDIKITGMDDSDLTQGPDTLKALKFTRMNGIISDGSGGIMENYNGTVTVTVFDKPVQHQTLGTEDPVMNYLARDNILFRGDAAVKNGTFNVEFVVPKDINYKVGKGRIDMYSVNEQENADAIGSNSDFWVGATQNNFTQDSQPPDIKLYLYDTTYHQGDLTGPNPVLVAELHDDHGISTTSYGLDKGIIAHIDDQLYDLTDYYKANANDYRNGTIEYQLTNLVEGTHVIELSARDTYNNTGTAYLTFTVSDKRTLLVDDLLNYPNPFSSGTTFTFKQNRAGEDLQIVVDIFNMNGEEVRQLNYTVENSDYKVDDLWWDGTNATGKKLGGGLYIYKVTVRSLLDGAKISKFHKLVLNY